MTKTFPLVAPLRAILLASLCGLLALPAFAEMRPSINLMGSTGLIDMPSGEQQPDGYLTFGRSSFGPTTRNNLTFQILPRLSGSFRYLSVKNWNDRFCPPDCKGGNAFKTYFDRNFDLRYQLLTESKYLPAVTVGLQDFVGTGLSMGEYVAATKTFGSRLKVTAGLGFGRLGSYRPIGAPLGPRPEIDFGLGGTVNYNQWFRGDAAPFGGLEYQVSDKVAFKAEYSSDIYSNEAALRGTFERRSPFNFGIEYKASEAITLAAYSMYGSEFGFSVNIALNPDQRPNGGMGGSGPLPVKPRIPRSQDPTVWGTEWLMQADAKTLLIENMTGHLVRTGIDVESIGVTGDTAQIRFRNTNYDAVSQAAGRVARAMSHLMPASVETFEIVPVVNGLATAKITIRRSDLEALEFAPDSGALMRARTTISPVGAPLPDFAANADLYPKFTWSITPYYQTMLFNPGAPFELSGGARLSGRFEISPGFVVSASATKAFVGGISRRISPNSSRLPPVRSDAVVYYTEADPGIESLTASFYGKLAPEVYGRVTAGYLEQMFGGVSAEVLWKPVDRRWALGAEMNYVAQRDTDGGFGFDEYDYQIATGHISGYYDLGKGFQAQLDLGRYLAGDLGGTVTLMRTFSNGWKVGAFATITNVSARDFGEGSFDKGLKFEIPLTWFTGKPSRSIRPFTLRPVGRDGGARLQVNDRLYGALEDYDLRRIDAQWGRFWK